MKSELEKYSQAISKSLAEIQEAFVLDQIKPFLDYDEKLGIVTIKQSVRLRLQEIEDYKHRVRQELKKLKSLSVEEGDWLWKVLEL